MPVDPSHNGHQTPFLCLKIYQKCFCDCISALDTDTQLNFWSCFLDGIVRKIRKLEGKKGGRKGGRRGRSRRRGIFSIMIG